MLFRARNACGISPAIDSCFRYRHSKKFHESLERVDRDLVLPITREWKCAPVWYRCFRWQARFLGSDSVARIIPTNPDRVFLFLFSFSCLFLTLTCARTRSIKLSARSITIDNVERNSDLLLNFLISLQCRESQSTCSMFYLAFMREKVTLFQVL